ncbi:nucleoside transporter C-terminal domain-containing protein [Pelagicoccus sp. SDUM812003]|uniref:NupC/NupG family nucleoside CNT transporter n=1 Tax=Pelagicoccus sp. SDUM812003 TaxID=3041267 RepID=UPI0028109699|nr:nucleoside transporter C-terminal domain-containing protein [Pelagicoccus sp. SDUM812003]MDQ8205331.1 nucleoside transporter C-terminal domain-containing protein [Pelagicoccus sp. SDUM812003]
MDTLLTLLRALIGIAGLLSLCWFVSEDRRRIDWKLVGSGIALQIVLALLILKVPFIHAGVAAVSSFFRRLIGFSDDGAEMVFGSMPSDVPVFGMAWTVLSAIVFFSAFSAILYHLKVLQVIVYVFAWLLSKALKLSGAESLAAAANVFIGQTEAPLVVRPYLKNMTRSEINSLMTGGMATIAGGVLAIYMSALGGDDPAQVEAFGKHLLTASILSAPAALVAAKIIAPQTESVDGQVAFPKEKEYDDLLDAATKGTSDGLKLALNVAAMLIAFTGLVALLDYAIGSWIGEWTGLNAWVASATDGKFDAFDFSFIIGVASAPFAWLLGVPNGDLLVVGQLLGERLVFNELFAYLHFAELKSGGALEDGKSILILTYALCGFANIASIGIQVGGISALEPSQRGNLLRYGFRALVGGMVACYLTAIIASTIQSGIY